MLVEAYGLEFRGIERRTAEKSKKVYLVVRMEDSEGNSYKILDWNLDHMGKFKKGDLYDLTLELRFGKYSGVSIKRMVPHKG